MTGYKHTELGVIPEDWETPTIQELLDRGAVVGHLDGNHGELYPRSHEFTESGVPYVTANDLRGHRVSFDNCKHLSKQRAGRFRKGVARNGDVLFAHNATVGPTALLSTDLDYVILSTTATYFRCNPEKLLNSFLLYAIQSAPFVGQYRAVMAQSTRNQVPITAQRKLSIVLPSTKAEQQAIAETLTDADALIKSLEQLVAKQRHLTRATRQHLLTGKKRLPGFSDEWQNQHVEQVITKFFCGPSPTCEERNISGDFEWGVLKTTAITWENGWDWTKHKVLPKVLWNQPNIQVRAGDVIVTKAGPRHRVGVTAWVDYVPPRIAVSGKMIGLRPNPDKAVPLILAAAISARHAQVYLDQRTTGMAESQVNFENSVLLKTIVKLPQIDEQRAIATILSDFDAEITAMEAKLAKARELKKGMMQELLTGRIRLV